MEYYKKYCLDVMVILLIDNKVQSTLEFNCQNDN